MEGDKLQQITKEFNRIFEEEVAPYRILNGLVAYFQKLFGQRLKMIRRSRVLLKLYGEQDTA
jgi:hypothetical protein